MNDVLNYRENPDVQKLINDPRVLGSNSFRSFFDNMRKVAKELDLLDVSKHLLSKGDAGYQIHASLIDEEPGFNPRDYNDPEVQESISFLAERYAADQFVEDITAIVRDGRILVREGHTRRHGFRKAINELNAGIVRLSVRPFSGSRDEEDLIPITSNSGNRLRPMAAAVIYQRQIERHGKSPAEVAKAIGKTETHVRQTLKLLDMPKDMQDMVRKNQIAQDLALELVNDHGINAVAKAQEALADETVAGEVQHDGQDKAQAQAAPKRVTRKKVEKGTSAAIKLNKKSKEQLWSTLDRLAGKLESSSTGKAVIELDEDEIQALKNLHSGFHEQIHGKPTHPDDDSSHNQ